MKFEKIDLIYNSGTNKTFLIGYLASLISGTRKTIVAIHSTNAPKKKKVTTPISRWIIRRVQRVVMVANAQKRIVCQRENINHNNVTVIHNGIPVKRLISADYYDYKQINVFADNPKVVGIVARLDDEKNHITFLDVAKIVCKEIEMAYFVIVGDGPERQYLEYYCHKLALNDNVRFVGSQNEIGRILPLFNVGVLTSYNETFPLSILEMMGVGIPVVVTDVGGLREMISNGEEGFIVPTHKPQLIADKIIELLRDKNKSKVMGQKGRTRVLSDFTVERMAEKYQQLFREIIEL